MPSSGMWHHLSIVTADVFEENDASIFSVERIRERETALVVFYETKSLEDKR
jgi:hypothetical protein